MLKIKKFINQLKCMTHLKAFDKMNEENLKKAVEAFLSPKKQKV